MSVREWYVIDTRTNEIVNCITTMGHRPDNALEGMRDREHLRLDADPPSVMLQRYRFWDERP